MADAFEGGYTTQEGTYFGTYPPPSKNMEAIEDSCTIAIQKRNQSEELHTRTSKFLGRIQLKARSKGIRQPRPNKGSIRCTNVLDKYNNVLERTSTVSLELGIAHEVTADLDTKLFEAKKDLETVIKKRIALEIQLEENKKTLHTYGGLLLLEQERSKECVENFENKKIQIQRNHDFQQKVYDEKYKKLSVYYENLLSRFDAQRDLINEAGALHADMTHRNRQLSDMFEALREAKNGNLHKLINCKIAEAYADKNSHINVVSHIQKELTYATMNIDKLQAERNVLISEIARLQAEKTNFKKVQLEQAEKTNLKKVQLEQKIMNCCKKYIEKNNIISEEKVFEVVETKQNKVESKENMISKEQREHIHRETEALLHYTYNLEMQLSKKKAKLSSSRDQSVYK